VNTNQTVKLFTMLHVTYIPRWRSVDVNEITSCACDVTLSHCYREITSCACDVTLSHCYREITSCACDVTLSHCYREITSCACDVTLSHCYREITSCACDVTLSHCYREITPCACDVTLSHCYREITSCACDVTLSHCYREITSCACDVTLSHCYREKRQSSTPRDVVTQFAGFESGGPQHLGHPSRGSTFADPWCEGVERMSVEGVEAAGPLRHRGIVVWIHVFVWMVNFLKINYEPVTIWSILFVLSILICVNSIDRPL